MRKKSRNQINRTYFDWRSKQAKSRKKWAPKPSVSDAVFEMTHSSGELKPGLLTTLLLFNLLVATSAAAVNQHAEKMQTKRNVNNQVGKNNSGVAKQQTPAVTNSTVTLSKDTSTNVNIEVATSANPFHPSNYFMVDTSKKISSHYGKKATVLTQLEKPPQKEQSKRNALKPLKKEKAKETNLHNFAEYVKFTQGFAFNVKNYSHDLQQYTNYMNYILFKDYSHGFQQYTNYVNYILSLTASGKFSAPELRYLYEDAKRVFCHRLRMVQLSSNWQRQVPGFKYHELLYEQAKFEINLREPRLAFKILLEGVKGVNSCFYDSISQQVDFADKLSGAIKSFGVREELRKDIARIGWEGLRKDIVRIGTEVGVQDYKQGNYGRALEHLKIAYALETTGHNAKLITYLVKLTYDLGVKASQDGNSSEALRLFKIACALNPADYNCDFFNSKEGEIRRQAIEHDMYMLLYSDDNAAVDVFWETHKEGDFHTNTFAGYMIEYYDEVALGLSNYIDAYTIGTKQFRPFARQANFNFTTHLEKYAKLARQDLSEPERQLMDRVGQFYYNCATQIYGKGSKGLGRRLCNQAQLIGRIDLNDSTFKQQIAEFKNKVNERLLEDKTQASSIRSDIKDFKSVCFKTVPKGERSKIHEILKELRPFISQALSEIKQDELTYAWYLSLFKMLMVGAASVLGVVVTFYCCFRHDAEGNVVVNFKGTENQRRLATIH